MIPEIRNDHGIETLYVNGEPFFMLSGEIHNSSASDLDFMDKNVWQNIKDLNMNSVIVPLYWELMEKEEGVYDFSLIKGLIDQARHYGKKLAFLWFGLWKNAESFYVPQWMKVDTETYFRVEKVDGKKINTISPLCEAAIEKDVKAFSEVMKYIRSIDEEESTVIIMQVENEIGILGSSRDYCPAANAAFEGMVPEVLTEGLGLASGTWREVFGKDAEESFMAYYFAKAVEKITKAGRNEYPLPCYANSWLKQYPWYAGSYPSGGPVVGVQQIWKVTAPSLFTLAPDIYVPYVPQIMDDYHYEGNPLFIPEVRKDAVTASYCLYAFAQHNAICYAPFGVEELGMDPDMIDKPPMEVMIALNIDPSAFDIAGSKDYLAKAYDVIENIKPIYLKYRGTEHLKAFVKKHETDYGTFLEFEKYNIQVAYAPRMPRKPVGGGMIFELSEDTFLIIGMQASLTFTPKPGENVTVNVLSFESGEVVNGEWKCTRTNNGDEVMSFNLADMPTSYMIKVYKF